MIEDRPNRSSSREGWSDLKCAPRLSRRASAHRATSDATVAMLHASRPTRNGVATRSIEASAESSAPIASAIPPASLTMPRCLHAVSLVIAAISRARSGPQLRAPAG